MLPIFIAALCVAVTSADSSMNSYPPVAGAVREYEYAGGSTAYLSSKPTYEYVAAPASGSIYAKSDTARYMADASTDTASGNADTRASYYKTKYGSDSVVNSLRASPSSSSSVEQTSSQQEYPSSQTSSAETYTTTTGGSGVTYTYGEREHPNHVYTTSAEQQQQPQQYSRPSSASGTVYASYSASAAGSPGVEYGHLQRPGFSHGKPTSVSNYYSSPSASDYPSSLHSQPQYHLHPPHMSSSSSSSYPGYEESYPAPHHHSISPQASSPMGYKYIMSSANSPSKYQTVLGAIKSLFGGGGFGMSDAAPSASHHYPTSYYSSPSSSMMSHHHPLPAGMMSSSSNPVAVGSSPGYFYSSSFHPYSKSYPPMRFLMGYGGAGGHGSSGPSAAASSNKIIVVRDSASTLGSGYPSSLVGPSMLGSPSSYASTKSKIYGPSPSSYLTASPSSMHGYISGPPSSGYPSYSSSPGFPGGHGGSTFLGYST